MRISQGRLKLLNSEVVRVEKADGRSFDDVEAGVHKDKLFFNDPELPLEVGDVVKRKLPSGIVEEFEIVDPNFRQGLHSIPAHYQSVVRRRQSLPPHHVNTQQVTNTYYLHGDNSRVNIQSEDRSINLTSTPETVFTDMKAVVEAKVPVEAQSMIVAAIDEMELVAPGSSFRDKYLAFVSIAADHLGVLSPFLPLLTGMLRG